MREYNNCDFSKILNEVYQSNVIRLDKQIDLKFLKYFMFNNGFRLYLIDDYSFDILDKTSLLEAMYYQMEMVDMHDLNWDAFHEGLEKLNKREVLRIVIAFRHGLDLEKEQPNIMKIFEEIVLDINSVADKKITILMQ